ncbi:MAG TPA: hypothetical protein VGO13_07095 [Solirubrobacterales bacterium]|jgi:hypothetical protein|nr:hypothetical protein [Solirubrobacterales bacterium]
MRHGFLQEVPSLVSGTLPGGLESSWLAQVDYVYEGRGDLERSAFTLVLTEATDSSDFAVRVLCHDRGLGKRDRSNPDADRQVVELDDKAVRLESDQFLRRYAVSTDHDQDQLSVWRLFDPSLIQWLTAEAPPGFSFELQDGALSCFVPGFTADEAELDALCAAAARVFARVVAIAGSGGESGAPAAGSREEQIERELAEHPFADPPKNTKAAAKPFRGGLTLGDRAWSLGAEAFFRAHAAAVGFERIPNSAFRAGHVDTFMPGALSQVARGRVATGAAEAFLIFTNDESYDDMGWSVLVVDLVSPAQGVELAQSVPRGDRSQRGLLQAGTDGRSLILSALDGGARDRSAAEFEAFFAAASALAGPVLATRPSS